MILRTHADPLPHEGGCEGCRDARQCNVCGGSIRDPWNRCTNGRCLACHRGNCSSGGNDGPGHGFWRSVGHRLAALGTR